MGVLNEGATGAWWSSALNGRVTFISSIVDMVWCLMQASIRLWKERWVYHLQGKLIISILIWHSTVCTYHHSCVFCSTALRSQLDSNPDQWEYNQVELVRLNTCSWVCTVIQSAYVESKTIKKKIFVKDFINWHPERHHNAMTNGTTVSRRKDYSNGWASDIFSHLRSPLAWHNLLFLPLVSAYCQFLHRPSIEPARI